MRTTRRGICSLARLTAGVVAAGFVVGGLSGCIIGAAIGGMAESARRTGTTSFDAAYEGLGDKSFTVVCHADRSITGSEPGIVARITSAINDRLALNAGASHGIPSKRLLAKLYNNPQWTAMAPGEVAEMLGVQRLVWIDLVEYRLNEPGNQYLWDGVATGNVYVYESDSSLPDDPVFQRSIGVTFPDSSGFMRTEIPENAVATELSNRFINRAAWLFYDHEESNSIAY